MIRVAVVSPAIAVRAGLRALLGDEAAIEVTGEAASLSELLPGPENIDVLVLGYESLSDAEIEETLQAARDLAVLILVGEQAGAVRSVLGLPVQAWGLLPLEASTEDLLAAVSALHQGLLVGAPSLIKPLFADLPAARDLAADDLIEPLTERETEVLQLLAEGLANKQIAVRLGISEHTVKFHGSAIYAKLGAASRTEAVRIGVRRGLILL